MYHAATALQEDLPSLPSFSGRQESNFVRGVRRRSSCRFASYLGSRFLAFQEFKFPTAIVVC